MDYLAFLTINISILKEKQIVVGNNISVTLKITKNMKVF